MAYIDSLCLSNNGCLHLLNNLKHAVDRYIRIDKEPTNEFLCDNL